VIIYISIFAENSQEGMTILFDEIVFGPVRSRRFGVSLGINLLPLSYKYCTFNCIYCECGWSFRENAKKVKLPTRDAIRQALDERLQQMKREGKAPDHLTFAGNGEPTVHPAFDGIIDDTIGLRNQHFPNAQVTVLSNASLLHKKSVFDALNKVDNNVLKLDSVIESTFRRINQPSPSLTLETIIDNIKRFSGNQVVQTLFMRGKYNDEYIDNTSPAEVGAWIKVLEQIRPKYVMIYPIERDTAAPGIEKVPLEDLRAIADQVEQAGIKTKIYY
jgi:wyosine [tRNA(Phe)-imidazoG37] synthetase (radical SAM superfamily)